MPVLLRHSRHVYSCVPARTHTSMRVLLRHNRHRTGRSRSGASQLQETKQLRAEQPCTQQSGAKQPVPPHRNQKQRLAAVKRTATKHTTRAQQPGVTERASEQESERERERERETRAALQPPRPPPPARARAAHVPSSRGDMWIQSNWGFC